MSDKIKRHEFLKSLGLKGASLVAVYCGASAVSSCKNETGITPSSSADFTLDLSQAAYSKLNNVGSYVVTQNVVVARVSSTAFAAVTQICSHEGRSAVIYSSGGFYCPEHGATFDTSGKGLNANGSRGLTTYKTTLTGNSLRVYS
ncbi:ubiquinol-cytochrome c reductase iron-sulfur subunit [Aquirufa beregesia]